MSIKLINIGFRQYRFRKQAHCHCKSGIRPDQKDRSGCKDKRQR